MSIAKLQMRKRTATAPPSDEAKMDWTYSTTTSLSSPALMACVTATALSHRIESADDAADLGIAGGGGGVGGGPNSSDILISIGNWWQPNRLARLHGFRIQ
jgi:hypothetical protein